MASQTLSPLIVSAAAQPSSARVVGNFATVQVILQLVGFASGILLIRFAIVVIAPILYVTLGRNGESLSYSFILVVFILAREADLFCEISRRHFVRETSPEQPEHHL